MSLSVWAQQRTFMYAAVGYKTVRDSLCQDRVQNTASQTRLRTVKIRTTVSDASVTLCIFRDDKAAHRQGEQWTCPL